MIGDVPLTVLGGYLGSGKTTLVNAMLSGAAGRRVAVLVNDFGAVNIDADLIRRRGATTVELANGCVCCSLVDGMAQAMVTLAGLDPRPEYAVVELSGVADPGKMAAWGRYPGFTPGGVLVCADAETVRAKAVDKWVGDTVTHQLSTADVVLLTKTDLVGEREAAEVRAWLARTVPDVPVVEVAGAGPDGAARVLLDPPVDTGPAAHGDGGHGPHAEHHAWSGEAFAPVDRAALESALDALDPAEVVRVKGVVRLADSPDRRTLVQAVGRRRELTDDGPWPGPETPSRLVAIAVHAEALAEAAHVLTSGTGLYTPPREHVAPGGTQWHIRLC